MADTTRQNAPSPVRLHEVKEAPASFDFGAPVDLGRLPLQPDPALLAALPAPFLIEHRLLPLKRSGGFAIVLCADLGDAAPNLPQLRAALGGAVRLMRADPAALAQALKDHLARPLALAAEQRRPDPASCRSLPRSRIVNVATVLVAILSALLVLAPVALMATLAGLVALSLLLSAALRLAAAWATLRRRPSEPDPRIPSADLPVISLLVPLYREEGIVGTLIPRMAALDYPRDRLDLCLVLEDDDELTRATLERSDPPPWVRVLEVPEGTLRTKPRALNYALGFARGAIVGVYDAEDLPAPDHLQAVAARFAACPSEVACLQGALDYFNCDTNWMARCFALEYAGWFRVLLPGLQRLGLALPLGGTTLFLRRGALEAVGGWDAHNVTEDADLGILLARRGYRTEMIRIASQEEATARTWPWIRQRSRWLKGYAVTWATHMRSPARLWRDLGPWRFAGFQLMFAGTLLQFALAPLLWSFWLVPLGLPHPLAPLLPPALLVGLSILFLASQLLDIAYAWLGARRAGKGRLAPWAPSLMIYFALATVAFYRALWDMARDPFAWDKTEHGIDLPQDAPRPVLPRLRPRAPRPEPTAEAPVLPRAAEG